MRLIHLSPSLLLLAGVLAGAPAALADAPPASGNPPSPEDVLGNMVVVAGAGRPLPKIGIQPSLASDMEDVTLRMTDLSLVTILHAASDFVPSAPHVRSTRFGEPSLELIIASDEFSAITGAFEMLNDR